MGEPARGEGLQRGPGELPAATQPFDEIRRVAVRRENAQKTPSTVEDARGSSCTGCGKLGSGSACIEPEDEGGRGCGPEGRACASRVKSRCIMTGSECPGDAGGDLVAG